MKNYNQSPLPFQGQKRRFLRAFKKALLSYPQDALYVDLFGGSGLLSHTVKQLYPEAKVLYNDYDGFGERLRRVKSTNSLLADIREMLKEHQSEKRIDNPLKGEIIQRIKKERGFVDFITLSASLLFSGKYATSIEELERQTFYNCIKQSDYEVEGYLEGVKIVCMDYKDLFQHYKNEPTVVFLIDPPYLSTDTKTYSSDKYWKLQDYLDVLDILKTGDYFYFTSNKSKVLELCEWVSNKAGGVNPFSGAMITTVSGHVNYSSSYTDIMIYKYTIKDEETT